MSGLPNPLLLQEMECYCRVWGVHFNKGLVLILRGLDTAFINHRAKEVEKQQKKAEKANKHVPQQRSISYGK